jgi:hypothetical protein
MQRILEYACAPVSTNCRNSANEEHQHPAKIYTKGRIELHQHALTTSMEIDSRWIEWLRDGSPSGNVVPVPILHVIELQRLVAC